MHACTGSHVDSFHFMRSRFCSVFIFIEVWLLLYIVQAGCWLLSWRHMFDLPNELLLSLRGCLLIFKLASQDRLSFSQCHTLENDILFIYGHRINYGPVLPSNSPPSDCMLLYSYKEWINILMVSLLIRSWWVSDCGCRGLIYNLEWQWQAHIRRRIAMLHWLAFACQVRCLSLACAKAKM